MSMTGERTSTVRRHLPKVGMVKFSRFSLLAAVLLGCGAADESERSASPRPAAQPTPPDPTLIARGEVLYADHCALCHGEGGAGYAADHAPALSNPDFLPIASDALLRVAIDYGRPGTPMSAWSQVRGGPFSQQDTRAVVAYLRSWQETASVDVGEPRRPRVDAERAVRGADLFATRCAQCHGPAGEGETAVSLNNPYFLTLATDDYLRYAITRGRRGTEMVSFADSLSDDQIGDLVALIRSWEKSPGAPAPTIDLPDFAEHVIVNPEGEVAEFAPREDRFVPADDVKAALDAGQRIVLLDARATSDWLAGHIPGAIPVPFYDATSMLDYLPRDGTWIIAYCACPHAASGQVVDALRDNGLEKTAILDEGVTVWEERGYPIVSPL